jgi:hypothetical protein
MSVSTTDKAPHFDNDHDALVFLIKNFNFSGGWTYPAGMGFDVAVYLDTKAPEWAKEMGLWFIAEAPNSSCHILQTNMYLQHVDYTLQRRDGRLILSRSYSDPVMRECPCVLKPQVLEQEMFKILRINSCASEGDMDPCELTWNASKKKLTFIPDIKDFCLEDENEKEVKCSRAQASQILEILKSPGMTEQSHWEAFEVIDSIILSFAGLGGDHHYCFIGSGFDDDITQECLGSKLLSSAG